MAIDPSIFSNVSTPQINMPSPLAIAQQAMTLNQLGMNQALMARQFQTQAATRQAYADNTDQNGNLDRQGFLSELGKNPLTAQSQMQYANQFAANDKAQAEAQSAKLDAVQKAVNITGPSWDYMAQMSPDQRAAAYPGIVKQLAANGVDTSNMPDTYEPDFFHQAHDTWTQSKASLENQLTQAQIGKTQAETAGSQASTAKTVAETPFVGPTNAAKLNTELYGSRSPNATLTNQYDTDAKPIRSSQIAMQQMMDNYNHPSPQGDASLVLNAYRIKFPNAPDVNSIEELSKSQSAPDTWKNMATKALSGGVDQPTRDNLMRDGISTFRANVQSLQGIQQRYQARQLQQGVYDPTLTAEPAINQTSSAAAKLQSQIGPYVPPSQRGGIGGALSSAASWLTGTGGSQSANASTAPAPKYRAAGSTVSADQAAQYATKHGMKLSDAQTYLRSQGYVIGN